MTNSWVAAASFYFPIGDKKNGEGEQGDAEDHGGEQNGASIDGY